MRFDGSEKKVFLGSCERFFKGDYKISWTEGRICGRKESKPRSLHGKKMRDVDAEGAAEGRRVEKQKKSDHFWRNVFKFGDDDFVPKKGGDAERYQNELFFKNLQQTYKQIRFTSAQPKRVEKHNPNTASPIPIHQTLASGGQP